MLDIAWLATKIATNFLVPFVKGGAKAVGEAIAGSGNAADADHASGVVEQVWDTVSGLFAKEDPKLLDDLKEDPESAKAYIESKLKRRLSENPDVAEALNKLVTSPGPSGQSVNTSIENSGIVGVLNMQHADLSQAQNLRFAGVNIEHLDPSAIPLPPDPKTAGGSGPRT